MDQYRAILKEDLLEVEILFKLVLRVTFKQDSDPKDATASMGY